MKTIKLGLAALAMGITVSVAAVPGLAQTIGADRNAAHDIARDSARSQERPVLPNTAPDDANSIAGIPMDAIPEGALVISDGQSVYIIMGVDDATLAALAEAMQQDQPRALKREVDSRDDRA